MLLSFSDIMISATLFVNAAAVLNFTVKDSEKDTIKAKVFRVIQVLQYSRYLILVWNLIQILFMFI